MVFLHSFIKTLRLDPLNYTIIFLIRWIDVFYNLDMLLVLVHEQFSIYCLVFFMMSYLNNRNCIFHEEVQWFCFCLLGYLLTRFLFFSVKCLLYIYQLTILFYKLKWFLILNLLFYKSGHTLTDVPFDNVGNYLQLMCIYIELYSVII